MTIEWDAYFENDRLRTKRRQQKIDQHKKLAWNVAKQLVRQLAEKYDVQQVILTGSLLTDRFSMTSDIDLGVKGLKPELYFKAWAELNSPAHPFDVDLIDLDSCSSIVRTLTEKGEVLYERTDE